MSDTTTAEFAVGQLVFHRLFEYRGVVIDVDPYFKGTDDWYDHVTRSKPPKDRPWYHVLVDGGEMRTYVAERNLEFDTEGTAIDHPDLPDYFDHFGDGSYVIRQKSN
jgi:heat shock protein HspQ